MSVASVPIEAWDRIRSARDALAARDSGVMIGRIVLAWVFIYHGAGTLFNAFDGPGLHRQAIFMATIAHLTPGTFFAYLNGITEFFGGIAVLLGVVTRLAALGLFVDMIIAMATVTFANGLVSSAPGGGYELNLVLAGLSAVIVLLGGGRLSLDHVAGRLWRSRAGVRTPKEQLGHVRPSL